MQLPQQITPDMVAKMTEAERIQLLKEAYAEFMAVVNSVKQQEHTVLSKALQGAEQKNIEAIRQLIHSLPS